MSDRRRLQRPDLTHDERHATALATPTFYRIVYRMISSLIVEQEGLYSGILLCLIQSKILQKNCYAQLALLQSWGLKCSLKVGRESQHMHCSMAAYTTTLLPVRTCSSSMIRLNPDPTLKQSIRGYSGDSFAIP